MNNAPQQPQGRKVSELRQALNRLALNDDFQLFLEELKSRKMQVVADAATDEVIGSHPRLIACVEYAKCIDDILGMTRV